MSCIYKYWWKLRIETEFYTICTPFDLPSPAYGSSAWDLWFEPKKRGKCRPLIWLNIKSPVTRWGIPITQETVLTYFCLCWNYACARDNIFVSVYVPLLLYPVNHYNCYSHLPCVDSCRWMDRWHFHISPAPSRLTWAHCSLNGQLSVHFVNIKTFYIFWSNV